MAILLEQNAEQTLNVKGSKLDLASYCEIEQIDAVTEEDKKLSLKETGRIHSVVNEYDGDQRGAITCSNERDGFTMEGLDRLNSSMEVHTISDPSMPVYTGYPAPGMASYVPYNPTDGVYYHNLQAVDYNYVHIQPPYGCNIPTGIPYVPQPNGYVPVYPYNFYQMASPEQYGAAYTGYANTDQLPVILQDHGSGYAIELDNVCDNLPPQSAFTYNPQRLLRASAPVWNNKNSERTKEKEDAHSSKSKVEGDQVLSSVSSSPNGHDTKTKGFSDDGKKQYRRVVSAGSVLSRKAWPYQVGAFQYVAVTQTPTKVLLRNHQERSDSDTVSSAKLAKAQDTNLSDFSLDSGDAKHFVIKSFSEENVFRSIEHGVWSSTPSGNHKLNVAFQESQERALAKGNNNKCPVFLYFSVNGSGRFCGVAEMVGSVEFKKTMEFWDRNKWCGSFPVKWHIIKDVPNSQLRRIILQNNESKPVTSSRDTQEISNHRQGSEMLNIFKNYSTKVSILDRFPNLSTRQNIVNYDKEEEISGEDGRDQQLSNDERDFVKPTEMISSNPIKAWNTGLKHPDDNNNVLKKRKPLLPGKIAQDLNVNNVVGKDPKKENVVMMPYGGVKA